MDYTVIAETYRSESAQINRIKQEAEQAAYNVYVEVVSAAEKVRTEARNEAQRVYDEVVNGAYKVRTEAEEEAKAKADAALSELMTRLVDGDEGVGKLFAWMVSGSTWYRRFPEHCTIILAAMPLSVQGLKELSAHHGWCSDFDSFLREALIADVIPGATLAETTEYVLTTVMDNAGLGTRSQGQIRGLFDRLLAAIPADTAEVKDENTEKADA